MNIIDILAEKKLIKKEDVSEIKEELAQPDTTLDSILLKKGVSPEDLLVAKGEYLNIPVRSMENQSIPFAVLEYIPEETAQHYKFAPIGVKEGALEVGIVDPDNIEARDALNFIVSKINMPYKIFLVTEQDFQKIIEMYKGLSGEVTKALSELETELSFDTEGTAPAKPGPDGKAKPGVPLKPGEKDKKAQDAQITEEAPVVKIVATIVRYATEGSASDVHIEPMSDKVRVRFRVDGTLNTSLVLPLQVHNAVVARIKVLSNMKLDERRKPQDGRFSARIEGRKIDFRVSTFPAYYGEKIVMRILDQAKGVKKIEDMGLTEANYKMIKEAINKPYGLILITGPTGSGKSTTLYSMLNEVDREGSNVLSLEDPIEYNVEGMSQSQVKPEIGYTFANGLRTALRQDPDIIMVGEIRDKETAQLAVQAALTGHLVFSTLHTNTAAGAIPRLIDMGVDPYLIAPTLVLAIGQRLVTQLCPGAGKPIPVDGSVKLMIDHQFADLPDKFKKDIPFSDSVHAASPTAECPNGVRGRTAVFEVFKMDKDIEAVILKSPTELEITKLLRQKGMLYMKEDALIKAFKKEIPFEEVNKL